MDYNFDINIDLERLMGKYGTTLNLARAVEIGIKSGIKDFSEKLLSKLIENISSYGLGDSNMIGQLNLDVLDDGLSLTIDGEYAMFVEYGTGIVGEHSPHPKPDRHNWIYDINSHGDEGWWYPSTSSDPNPTKYQSENGWWAWTAGMSSRPFMYTTWLWASRSVNNIITSHIVKEIKKEINRGGD